MEKTVNKGTAGVSLIEIMITMVLIALMLIAITSLFPRMTTYSKSMHGSDMAKVIAAEIIDGLQTFSKDDLFSQADDDNNVANVPGYSDFAGRYRTNGVSIGTATYRATWSFGAANANGIKTVTVNVSWQDNANKTHTVTATGAVR
jgi:Tfp pilus assembly protein PilV